MIWTRACIADLRRWLGRRYPCFDDNDLLDAVQDALLEAVRGGVPPVERSLLRTIAWRAARRRWQRGAMQRDRVAALPPLGHAPAGQVAHVALRRDLPRVRARVAREVGGRQAGRLADALERQALTGWTDVEAARASGLDRSLISRARRRVAREVDAAATAPSRSAA